MAGSALKKIMPAFIPLALELLRHVKRDSLHNNNIRKFDKTEEKLATLENLIAKLEKRFTTVREDLKSSQLRLQIWLALNTAILIAIGIKVFMS